MRQLALDALGVAGLAALGAYVREAGWPGALLVGGIIAISAALMFSGRR